MSDIAVTNGGRSDALRVSWRPAIGVVDSYLVRLQDRTRTLHILAVSHSSPPECTFSSLVAGRLYTVVIVTRTGSLENATAVQTRTREWGGGWMGRVEERGPDPSLSFRTCHCPEPDGCPLCQRRLPQGRWGHACARPPAADACV